MKSRSFNGFWSEIYLNGFDCVPTTVLNLLPCGNLNSFRWKKASLCDSSLWNFAESSSGAGPVWVTLHALVSGVQWTHAELKHQLRGGDLNWWANGCDTSCTESLSFSPVIHSRQMSYEHILGWRESKWRPPCPARWWLIFLPPSQCRSFACRLSWPLNHSTCSGACYCATHKNKRGGEILLLGCQKQRSKEQGESP